MVQGMIVRSWRGTDGQISVPGLGAVIAEFQSWSLVRHEESGSAGPIWTLHAVFRYQNDLLLKNDGLKKRMTLKLNSSKTFLLCDWDTFKVEGVQLVVEGVRECPPKN